MNNNSRFSSNLQIDRKIEVNLWLIRARWLYVTGILVIGVLTKIMSSSNVYFSYFSMFLIFSTGCLMNLIFFFFIKKVRKDGSMNLLNYISCAQIMLEIVVFLLIMHLAGGIESISIVFFFLPVVAASLIFGIQGSLIAAMVCGLLVNALALAEYYGYILHIPRYDKPTLEFYSLSITLTKTITIWIFYAIVGAFSGFGARLLSQREKMLEEKTEKLNQETKLRAKELIELNKTTKLLVRRDAELTQINNELDHNIEKLERSKRELQIAKAKSEKEREKTFAIISNFSDPIIVLGKNNKLILFNPAARDILGVGMMDLGKSIPGNDNFSLENFRKIIKKEFTFQKIKDIRKREINEEEMHLKSGEDELVYKVITLEVISELGEKLGVMKIFYDLTREKMIDRMKSEFISIAAHQLRTPLSGVKWALKMVIDGDTGKVNQEQVDLLSQSYDSNERMIHLVNDLLNVSRLEEGRFGYTFALCDFSEVIELVKEEVATSILKRHIDFSVSIPKNLPKICMDKDKIALAMGNFVENAIKYSKEGGKVELGAKFKNNFLEISVKDYGFGIPSSDQEKLFTKFFRASNAVKLQVEGTGLGLFIAKNIITKHGGSIKVNSKEGEGTEIIFTILSDDDKCKIN